MPFADVNGFRMHYEDVGNGSALIFHHGWVSTGLVWERVVRELEGSYRCIVLDARGAGESGRPDDGHTIKQYADDMLALATSIGLERFTAIGHSMGGVIATQSALSAPERVERLVLVASTPDAAFVSEGLWGMLIGLSDVLAAGNRDAATAFFTGITARREGSPLVPLAQQAVACSPEFIRGSIRDCAQFNPATAIEALQTPTLIAAASADPFLPAALTAFERLPNSVLHVFSRVSHGIPWEVPAELAGAIDDFMRHGVVTAQTLASG